MPEWKHRRGKYVSAKGVIKNMKRIKSLLMKGVLLCAALAMVMLPACGGGGTQSQTKPTINFYDGGWESQWLEIAIAQFIIEKGYGYSTKSIEMTNEIYQASLLTGDVDVDMECWKQNVPEWFEAGTKAGKLVPLSNILEGGPQFFIIPKWVAEQYNIKTIFDMKDHWELFKDPADPTKGIFINAIIGWSNATLNEAMLKAYGLDKYYNIITPGSSGAETAALAGPQKKKQPVFGYYWAPTALMGMYDWCVLEEPAHDPAVWAKVTAAALETNIPTIEKACAYPDNPLPIVINAGLRQKAPDVVAMFEKMTVGLDRCNKVLSWVDENGVKNWEKTAVYFLRQYDSHWKTWVTPDAYTKIKAALDTYGPVP